MGEKRVEWCEKCDHIGKLYIVDLDTGLLQVFDCDACSGRGYIEHEAVDERVGRSDVMWLVEIVVRNPRTGEGMYKTLDAKVPGDDPVAGSVVENVAEAVRLALPELVSRLAKKEAGG